VQKIQPSYKGVQIVVEENIERDRVLSPLNALHLFRILQESLNNSLKHSKCSRLVITFKCDKECTISVEDDGKGFDPDDPQHHGNGLLNMGARAREAGITMAFRPATPNGTRLILSLT
jgi:signal transduction histidine kinase